MAKTLRVIEPFLIVDTGDTFEYDEQSGMYVSQRREEYYKNDDRSLNDIKSVFSSNFQISVEYAQELIKDGLLEEATEKEPSQPFVNIFDEIDSLIEEYTTNLKNLDVDFKDLPACVKIERQTVLQNMITLLKHLKSLKK